MNAMLWRGMWNAHRWLGLACALFLLAQAVSGALMVVQNPLNLVGAIERQGPSPDTSGIDRALQTLSTRDPEYAPVILTPPPRPSYSWQVYLSPTQGVGPRRLASIDARTGEVLSDRPYAETDIGGLLQLHAELFAGEAGRWALLLIGGCVAILAVLGVVILRNRWRTLTSNPLASSMRWRALHRWSGIVSAVFVLLWMVSGLLLQWSMLGSGAHAVANTHATTPLPWDVSMRDLLVASEALEVGEILAIALPTSDQPQVIVTMFDPTAMPWSKFTVLLFDPSSGGVLSRIGPADLPLWDRVMATARALHMGIFEVPTVQTIYVLLAMLVATLAITGPVTWLRARWRRG